MKFPGCSHMASSQLYTYTHVSLDPRGHLVSVALDVYRISRDPMALQELLFPQHVRHAEIPDATPGCAQSGAAQLRTSDPSPAGWTPSTFAASYSSQELVLHFSFLHPFYRRKVRILSGTRRTK